MPHLDWPPRATPTQAPSETLERRLENLRRQLLTAVGEVESLLGYAPEKRTGALRRGTRSD